MKNGRKVSKCGVLFWVQKCQKVVIVQKPYLIPEALVKTAKPEITVFLVKIPENHCFW